MISPTQFEEFVGLLEDEGLRDDTCENNPSNLLIRKITGNDVARIFKVMPVGVWPDIFEVEMPPRSAKRAPSGYLMIFRKEIYVESVPGTMETFIGGEVDGELDLEAAE